MPPKTRRNKWKSAGLITLTLIGLAWLALTLGIRHFTQQSIAEFKEFTTSWEAKGETLDLNTFFPPQTSDSKKRDFHQHPAFLKELTFTNSSPIKKLEHIEYLEINGLAQRFQITTTSLDEKPSSPGFITNIDQWLDPPVSGLSEKETAQRILSLLAPLNTRIDALSEASKRPEAYYEKPLENYEHTVKVYVLEKNLFSFLIHRSSLRLLADDTSKAFLDLSTAIHLCQITSENPCLLGYIHSIGNYAHLCSIMQIVLETHAFSEEQLASIATQLNKTNLQLDLTQALRGEIAFMCTEMSKSLKSPQASENDTVTDGSQPVTWKERYDDYKFKKAPAAYLIHNHLPDIREVTDHLLYWKNTRTDTLKPEQIQWLQREDSRKVKSPTLSIANSVLLAVTDVRLMRTAIDLERYRLIHQDYPAKLNDLVPEFTPHLPIDLYTSKSLLYKYIPESKPLLYSTGIDQVDNGGTDETDDYDLLWDAP